MPSTYYLVSVYVCMHFPPIFSSPYIGKWAVTSHRKAKIQATRDYQEAVVRASHHPPLGTLEELLAETRETEDSP